MARDYGDDKKTALQAKTDAQKIAFGPIMFQAARLLRELGILEYLKSCKEGAGVKDIARQVNISEYGVLVLLEAGLSLELVRVKDDLFFLTKTGYFFYADELTRVNTDFTHTVNYKGFYHLEEAIKTGQPAGLHKEFGPWPTVYEALSELDDDFRNSWFSFDHFYSDDSFPAALPLVFADKPKNILDIGGNTGKFAIQCCLYEPDVKVTICDLPGQLADAMANVEKQGFGDRIDFFAVDFLADDYVYPKGYDVLWMSQFLDCFSEGEISRLLERAKNSMDKKASLYIMETFWDEQRFEASTYSLHATSLYFTCMANGNSRMYHSADMIDLVEKAGLKVDKVHRNIGISHTVLQCSILD